MIREDLIIFNLQSETKTDVIKEMIERLYITKTISNKSDFEKEIWHREDEAPTGVGDGIAIPHALSDCVSRASIVVGISKSGIDFQSIDNKPCHLFFMIAAPKDSDNQHLKLLSTLSVKLMKEEVRKKLMNASSYEEIIEAFTNVEENAEKEVAVGSNFIVAVTGCATGIAHTFMAEEKIKEAAKKLGVQIKVETNGATGVGNKLTQEDIRNADGVIIAADINVAMDRFDGKKLKHAKVAEGIHHAEDLIKSVVDGNIPVYHSQNPGESTDNPVKKANIYTHLLSGVSRMLPFVVAGGTLIALAFLVDQIYGVPTEELASLGSYSDLARTLNTIGGTAFSFMLPVLAGYIAFSIADRPGLVVGFVAGAMASSGGAGFLGALIGGFAAGYLVQGLKYSMKNLPKTFDGVKTILFYPVLGVLIIGVLMTLLNNPISQINVAMTNFLSGLEGSHAGLLGLTLGAMMAADLGGPINKAAYIFATGTLAATVSDGGSAIMAATMAAGMTPPLATYFASVFFKDKFTQSEKQAGITNIVMGASFITEGAIPFAAADPLRVIPSFMVGSAITAALVMIFNITVLAPHGGIFVILLVSSPLLYLGLILLGSLISAVMMGLLKKPVSE